MKNAYFAGGCFWCITPTFKELPGVGAVVSGYCGGDEANPTYEQVKHGLTHHRETICVEYDEGQVAYGTLLDLFLDSVDPFDGGGQFIDRGASYTLAVYYGDEAEREAAQARVCALEAESGRPVYVAIEPLKVFYAAEEYHQDYYLKNPEAFAEEMRASGREAACKLRKRR